MKHKSLIFALPLLGMMFTSCVKYNGKGSANPIDKVKITLSDKKLSLEEGKSATLSATVDRDVELNWTVKDTDVAFVDVPEEKGFEVTVKALVPGKTTISAVAVYNGHSFSAKCDVTVTRAGGGGGGGGGDEPPTPGPDTPVEGETVTTYLVIGENGLYKGEHGKDIAELFLEYAVAFEAKVGDALPTADDVTTTVKESKFQYWQAYNGDGALTKYEKVPEERGKILYACFGGGSGSVDPIPDPDVPSGSFTLYLTGLKDWGDDLAKTKIFLGANNNFVQATSTATGTYKATVPFSGNSFTVNAYIAQGEGDGAKYFHPYSGTKDYDVMYSTINVGSVSVADKGTYTIEWKSWAYDMDDYKHAWFNYSFSEGDPGTPSPTPEPTPSGKTITLYFAGVSGWQSISGVYFAINGDWKQAQVSNSANGQYAAEFTAPASVTSVNCYFTENDGSQYRHPYYEPFGWDTEYSTIVTGGVSVSGGNSYVVTWTDWGKNYDNWEHAWFTYTFTQVA